MKKIQIPFDLSKIDKDTRIETKGGYEVEILRTDLRGDYPIVGIVKKPNDITDLIQTWTIEGHFDKNDSDVCFDLVIVKECLNWWETHEKDRFEQFLINGYDKPEGHIITLCNARYPATPKLALQQYAFAKISHILKNDLRYGGMITNAEWNNDMTPKYCIINYKNSIKVKEYFIDVRFLAFHTQDEAERFIEEYLELVKQYLGIENDITF